MYKSWSRYDRRQQLAKTNKVHPTRKGISLMDKLKLSKACVKGYRQCMYNNGDGYCLLGADQCTKKEIK